MQWAIEHGLGAHPWDIQRRYSTPLLHLMFDAHWWSTYSPPGDDEVAPSGASGGSEMGRDGKPRKKTDTRKLSDAQFMGLFH